MGVDTQRETGFSRSAPAPGPAAAIATPLPAETHSTVGEFAALRAAVRLLAEAGRALPSNRDNARKYILRASALLQAESDFREHNADCKAGLGKGRLAPWQVTRVRRFIDANLSNKIGPPDFADLTRLSISHFARAFRATVGETPHGYLIRCRVERVKELMLETDLPLAQIALDCGLTDQAHMTRLFSRVVGVSPGAWRRVHVAVIDE